MLAEPLMIDKQGYVQVPERPGFGFVIDEDRVAHHTVHVDPVIRFVGDAGISLRHS
jgi:L-alanine-DL-glutamate epimerase-like enolase superfamily enzyme